MLSWKITGMTWSIAVYSPNPYNNSPWIFSTEFTHGNLLYRSRVLDWSDTNLDQALHYVIIQLSSAWNKLESHGDLEIISHSLKRLLVGLYFFYLFFKHNFSWLALPLDVPTFFNGPTERFGCIFRKSCSHRQSLVKFSL